MVDKDFKEFEQKKVQIVKQKNKELINEYNKTEFSKGIALRRIEKLELKNKYQTINKSFSQKNYKEKKFKNQKKTRQYSKKIKTMAF